jgi:hypothetical protein
MDANQALIEAAKTGNLVEAEKALAMRENTIFNSSEAFQLSIMLLFKQALISSVYVRKCIIAGVAELLRPSISGGFPFATIQINLVGNEWLRRT